MFQEPRHHHYMLHKANRGRDRQGHTINGDQLVDPSKSTQTSILAVASV